MRRQDLRGELIDVDDTKLVLESSGRRLAIPADSVEEVAALVGAGRDPLWNGALIGAAIGVGYVVAIFTYVDDVDTSGGSLARSFSIAAGIGAALGAWIDSLKQGGRRREVVYRAVR